MIMNNSEMIDIYNDNRELTGEVLPRKTKLTKGKFMLYVYALIKNQDGKYLVTKRALDKKWAAGEWEVPGGGAMAGESSRDAVRREVLEETGLEIDEENATVLYAYKNEDLESGDNYFADIYVCSKTFNIDDVKVEKTEAIDVRLVTFEEIKELYDKDGFLHYKRICEALGI